MRFGFYDPDQDAALTPTARTPRGVYLAAPFFKDHEVAEVRAVEAWLTDAGFTFYSPRLECRYVKGAPDERIVACRAFWLNKFHINMCSFIVACLSYPDSGTSWELGFGEATSKPKIGWTSNAKCSGNLMICGTVDAVVSFGDLRATLIALKPDLEHSDNVRRAVSFYDNRNYWQQPEE